MFGMGSPNVAPPRLEIWGAGSNDLPEGGTNDDELLGTGGTDSSGIFESSPGIGLLRPLIAGELIFAFDRQNNLVGPAVVVLDRSLPAPLLSFSGLGLAAMLLLAVGTWGMLRAARYSSKA